MCTMVDQLEPLNSDVEMYEEYENEAENLEAPEEKKAEEKPETAKILKCDLCGRDSQAAPDKELP